LLAAHLSEVAAADSSVQPLVEADWLVELLVEADWLVAVD
jgi:hypothetical protein